MTKHDTDICKHDVTKHDTDICKDFFKENVTMDREMHQKCN